MNDGTSPAYIAAQNGHEEALRVLAEFKADLNQVMDLPSTCQSIGHGRHVQVFGEDTCSNSSVCGFVVMVTTEDVVVVCVELWLWWR